MKKHLLCAMALFVYGIQHAQIEVESLPYSFEHSDLQESRIANGVVLSPNKTLAEVLRKDEIK